MDAFVKKLEAWYKQNKRDLPWRKTKNAYSVWISEIMLQQTRIDTVIRYYYRFLEKFPNVISFAEAPLDEAYKLWEGLGYYSRVKNMHKAAQIVKENMNGIFPTQYEILITLPGIGAYTASAIASICGNENKACVDGNVMRVISRLSKNDFDVTKEQTKAYCKNLIEPLEKTSPGDFNEALMELGERICLPHGTPLCDRCPIKEECLAHLDGTEERYPLEKPKIDKKQESYHFCWIVDSENILLRKRKEPLLQHSYEPVVFTTSKQSLDWLKMSDMKVLDKKKLPSYSHVFSHLVWKITGEMIVVDKLTSDCDYEVISFSKFNQEIMVATAYKKHRDKVKEAWTKIEEA
jgi:A/G-specific adenine glycosylase